MTPIRVILADDHPVWRQGIRSVFEAEPRLHVVAEASGGVEAIHLVRTVAADVLVLDMEMPDLSGVEVTRAIQEEGLALRVLALSAYADQVYVQSLLQNGASGYITKDKPPALIVEAVTAVAAGEGRWFVRPTVPGGAKADVLSERERNVLVLLAGGRTNMQIASEVFISESTVRNHLTNVYAKIGVANAREAVAWAWKNGLVS